MGDPSSENGNEVYEHRDFGCCRHRRPRGSLFVENTQLPKVAPNPALDKTRTNSTDFARVEASEASDSDCKRGKNIENSALHGERCRD
jgi:hypothetical protein